MSISCNMSLYSIVIMCAVTVAAVWGHGMLMDPVNRGSMWRLGYDVPADYNDNQQFCGGQSVQWEVNGGKCGECGDDYRDPRPREHENTGKYGLGIIVRKYSPGQVIDAKVKITTNHLGYFTFDLCPLKSSKELETDECFAAHPLYLEDGSPHYNLPTKGPGEFTIRLRIPSDVTCEQCVFRWTYRAGNTWGICTNGTGAMGCGPQEHFRGCADVSIA